MWLQTMKFLYNYTGLDKKWESKLASMYLEAREGTTLCYMHINQNLEIVFLIFKYIYIYKTLERYNVGWNIS